jgi:hypothetical protein
MARNTSAVNFRLSIAGFSIGSDASEPPIALQTAGVKSIAFRGQSPTLLDRRVHPGNSECMLTNPTRMRRDTTSKIVIFEPDEEMLQRALVGREVSPELEVFLKNLLQRKKWARKINIPSGHNNVAAALVFTTALKEAGLEIFSELHVFFAGKVFVEKWQVVGERERIALLPKEIFRSVDISKVRIDGDRVRVEFSVPVAGADSSEKLVKTYDFSGEEPLVETIPLPFNDRDAAETFVE